MFSKTATIKSTGSCWDNIKKAKKLIESADAVVIGAGAGLSTLSLIHISEPTRPEP